MKKQFTPASIVIAMVCVISLSCSSYLITQQRHLDTTFDYDHQILETSHHVLPEIDVIDILLDWVKDGLNRKVGV